MKKKSNLEPTSGSGGAEKALRKFFVEKLLGWSCKLEPGLGATVGAPDVLSLVGDRLELFELKVGWLAGDRLFCTTIRPAQVVWHKKLAMAGGRSFLVVGVKEARWKLFVVRGDSLSGWRDGFVFDDCIFLGEEGKIRCGVLEELK
jgi:hypothetical protein